MGWLTPEVEPAHRCNTPWDIDTTRRDNGSLWECDECGLISKLEYTQWSQHGYTWKEFTERAGI